ncbi:MAG: transcription-repair coupling factor [Alphaproteobacteria bacterium]|nr:transcription-repair coupling factor [Alphaproteobacteria bacterium]
MPDIMYDLINAPQHCQIGNVADGYHALVLADMARLSQSRVVFIARDSERLVACRHALAFFAPDIDVLEFPAWDCLPYDRSAPHISISATRMATLALLPEHNNKPHIVLTTISAAAQKLTPRSVIEKLRLTLRVGQVIDNNALIDFLNTTGYRRCSTVLEAGEYAVRGGIIDIFSSGMVLPTRLDFFGDTLESIHHFTPENQRRTQQLLTLDLIAPSEIYLDADAIKRFRQSYVKTFGTTTHDDALYQAVSEGVRHAGMEHWLPLFYEKVESLFDHCVGDTLYVLDTQAQESYERHVEAINDYYQSRKDTPAQISSQNSTINPLSPDELYILPTAWAATLAPHPIRFFSTFQARDISLDSKKGRVFTAERTQQDINLFDNVVTHIKDAQAAGKRVVVIGWSAGSRERLAHVLSDHGIPEIRQVETWAEAQDLPLTHTALAAFELESGFETSDTLFISEQDIMGDRMGRDARRRKRPADFISEAGQLTIGDYVVHIAHGIGRFEGLQTITIGGAPHDCLRIIYHGDSRLFLPVENIDLLSRYGGDDSNVALDKMGGISWQTRKRRLKERLREIAAELIRTAALRATREGEKLHPDIGLYDEFCARFAHDETDDQLTAIEAVLEDLGSGRPMDRLICGDVGFGKTEVALRAAFIAVMCGKQVAVIAPTTLLARQHTQTFRERFQGLPVKIGHLSRLVTGKAATTTREETAIGEVDIIIGTHALLAERVRFADLGLVIVDEEQHFGVTHKERLKSLRAEVHVLTLSATPIPRTLQMALSGVRDLSIIATPPIDRLAVRTYVSPFDIVVLREALLREKYRGGQSFVVVPRIADINEIAEILHTHIPEAKFVIAHGQMPPTTLEERMLSFYNGDYDILLSTSIIESGLDIPTANTIIIHRADMFGLAQLYQMRGRVGRSKLRAYAYLTFNERKGLSENANKRLSFMQSLDSLGAGFHLASYDMDLRGAGNIVGEAQSGHIKEVGVELYHAMLEEAVSEQQGEEREGGWSPQINLGLSVLLPDDYVPDLDLRMQLYRRLARLDDANDVEEFGVELIDRFGALPDATRHLLAVVKIKIYCLKAGIEKIDVGDKAVVVSLRNNGFANPEKLIAYISENGERIKLRPDQTLMFSLAGRSDTSKVANIPIVSEIVENLANLAV